MGSEMCIRDRPLYGEDVDYDDGHANDIEHGMLYDELSEKRSWNLMRMFLSEIFT